MEVESSIALQSSVCPENVIADWKDCVLKRKYAYNKYVSNDGRFELENSWKSQTPPFIPAEFLPKEMRYGESEREYEVRRKQKLTDFDAHLELLMVRRDEAFGEFSSIDTHIEESINELTIDDSVKNSLREEYTNLIKADEQGCREKWEKVKTKLLEKPQRETEKKIVIANDRMYAKGRAAKKSKKHKEKENVSPIPAPKEPEKKENSPQKQKKRKKNHHWQASPPFPHSTYAYPHHYTNRYQQPAIVADQQVPFGNHDVNKPPPKLPIAQLPTVQEANPHSYPFPWGQPATRWKYLVPVE